MKKITKIIIFMILIVACVFNYAYSLTPSQLPGATNNVKGIEDAGNGIITVVSTIGSIVSVVTLIALGIKYMLGSVEEKAQYKKAFMPYVIGAILVFAASFIASVVYNFAIQI